MAARLVDCQAQTVTKSPLYSHPDTFQWEQPGLDGAAFVRLQGDGRTPGEAHVFGLKLPENFLGHYCFNAVAELTVMRGELNVGSRRLRKAEGSWLAPGVIYSTQAEMPAILVISTTVPYPTRFEPRAPRTAGERC